jgi:hypothetical protein
LDGPGIYRVAMKMFPKCYTSIVQESLTVFLVKPVLALKSDDMAMFLRAIAKPD